MYEANYSEIPEMEVSVKIYDDIGGNSQHSDIILRAEAQPFKVNGKEQEVLKFTVVGAREMSELCKGIQKCYDEAHHIKEVSRKKDWQVLKDFDDMQEAQKNIGDCWNSFTRNDNIFSHLNFRGVNINFYGKDDESISTKRDRREKELLEIIEKKEEDYEKLLDIYMNWNVVKFMSDIPTYKHFSDYLQNRLTQQELHRDFTI